MGSDLQKAVKQYSLNFQNDGSDANKFLLKETYKRYEELDPSIFRTIEEWSNSNKNDIQDVFITQGIKEWPKESKGVENFLEKLNEEQAKALQEFFNEYLPKLIVLTAAQ